MYLQKIETGQTNQNNKNVQCLQIFNTTTIQVCICLNNTILMHLYTGSVFSQSFTLLLG